MPTLPPSDEYAEKLSVFRAALRRQKLAIRESLSPETHAALSARLEEHLAGLLAGRKSSSIIAFCSPIRKEFDAQPLIARLVDQGAQAAMPVVVNRETPMVFRPWTPQSEMTKDQHGIPIPIDEKSVVPDIILLPLVAFDQHGFRLGYGGGYFDRTLAALAKNQATLPLSVGIGFESALTETIQPQKHDIPLNAVVTEGGVMYYPVKPSFVAKLIDQ